MGAPVSRRHMSEADYLALEASTPVKHEFVAGEVFAMGGASERHNRISVNLMFHLRAASRGRPCGTFVADMRFKAVESDAYYYPDVMLTCDPADDHPLYKSAPCLVAEVLSPSTAATDTREKLAAYTRCASLRYYLMVDSESVRVRVLARDDAGSWTDRLLEGDELVTVACGEVRVTLGLADIYEDTGLAV